jgi:protein-S-isoprenylcysteine O-methyltransferase Ste14
LYFYSAVRPGLAFLDAIPGSAWLVGFYLPHYAETRSSFINSLSTVGAVLTGLGMVAFLTGVVQVYYAKIARKGPVTGGMYRFIRHPQYAALIVAGFGMLLVWPRYLMLVLYVSMVFVYLALAKHEEQLCLGRFGKPYADYLARTGRFFPALFSRRGTVKFRHGALKMLGIYIIVLASALAAARALETATLRSLYMRQIHDVMFVSVNAIDEKVLDAIVDTTMKSAEAMGRVSASLSDPTSAVVAYIVPDGRYISEIPMHWPDGALSFHWLKHYEGSRYGVIFTRMDRVADASGIDVLGQSRFREPLMEVWLDVHEKRISRILEPLPEQRYDGVPVPAY